jgi:hypothetical protein
MIKFITENDNIDTPVFEDVEVHHFFLDMHGDFCQKNSTTSYVVIADNKGAPRSSLCNGVGALKGIRKILPKITRIEF